MTQSIIIKEQIPRIYSPSLFAAFYFDIISNLLESCKNSTKNSSHITFVQTDQLCSFYATPVSFCVSLKFIFCITWKYFIHHAFLLQIFYHTFLTTKVLLLDKSSYIYQDRKYNKFQKYFSNSHSYSWKSGNRIHIV